MPNKMDAYLVDQGCKKALGLPKLSTLQRRLASLSVFMDNNGLQNHVRTPQVRKLLGKIGKLHEKTVKRSKAVVKDVLLDMIDVCGIVS